MPRDKRCRCSVRTRTRACARRRGRAAVPTSAPRRAHGEACAANRCRCRSEVDEDHFLCEAFRRQGGELIQSTARPRAENSRGARGPASAVRIVPRWANALVINALRRKHRRSIRSPQLLPRGNGELHQLRGPWDRFVCRIRQFDLDLVRTGFQSDEDHRFAARVDDRPRLVIHVVVKVSKPWRYRHSGVPEYRQDAQIFGPVLADFRSGTE